MFALCLWVIGFVGVVYVPYLVCAVGGWLWLVVVVCLLWFGFGVCVFVNSVGLMVLLRLDRLLDGYLLVI